MTYAAGRPGKPFFAELRVVRRNTDGARVKIADAHHDAAQGDERGCGEAEFLRAQKRRHGDVPARHQLSVRLDDDPVSEIVQHERLMRLGDDRVPREGPRGASPSWATPPCRRRNLEIRTTSAKPFGNAGRDRSDAGLRDELDVDARSRDWRF